MPPVRADIEVSIAAGPDRDAWFLVQTRSNHACLHGSHNYPIDARLMRPGETARIPLLALNPLTFSYLYASSYHPAYRYQTRRAGEMPSVDARRRDDAAYAQRLAAHEQGQLMELDALLEEIRALLAAGPAERLRPRALQARAVNAGTVYHELMNERDRQRIEAFLESQYRNGRSQPRPARTLQWLEGAAGIGYTIRLGPRYNRRGADGEADYQDCYRTGLEVDLYGGRETALNDTRRALQANFCRAGEGDWLIQLPGGG